jgi:hypothetical protein
MAVRAAHDPAQFHDVFFADFVSDPIATVREVYARFGLTLSPEAEQRMRAWQGGNPDGAQARPRRAGDRTGIPRATVLERFATYMRHFDLEPESP